MENEQEETVFKVPKLLIGPRPGTKKPIGKYVDTKQSADNDDDSPATNVTENIKDSVEEKIDDSNKHHKKTSQVPIPYQEPSWGGKPGDEYCLEVCVVSQ